MPALNNQPYKSREEITVFCVVALAVRTKGYGGVSASACILFGTQITKTIKCSRAADRHQWHATIKAVLLALETAKPGVRLIVHVCLNSIADAFRREFTGPNGRPMVDHDTGREVIEYAKAHDIEFTVVYAPKGPEAKSLQKEAKAAARARLAELESEGSR